MAVRYFECLDKENLGTIIRADGRKQDVFIPNSGWERSNMLMKYLYDDGEYYDMYKELNESSALKQIDQQCNKPFPKLIKHPSKEKVFRARSVQ
jgi:hypothetical protein